MEELDIDISSHASKSLDRFRDQAFDLVVTVCDNAKDACPVFPGATRALHWPFDDPADAPALEVLARAFPDREVVPVPGLEIVKSEGCVHCITQQQPLP